MKRKKNHNNVFIIAELSANHNKDINLAIRTIKAAKKAGADAIKIQTYTADTLTIDVSNKYFRIKHPKWGGQTLYQLYQKASMPWEWFVKLKKIADEIGIEFFSTAFDLTSVEFLEKYKVPMHKIASFELVDLELIKAVARTKKPLIMSTGMADLDEINDAVKAARKAGAKDISLLKCVSSYPADPKDMHLKTIEDLKRRFKCRVGLSDHTLGIGASVAAVALGATIIEKHFTLSRKIKTPDSFFSLEPAEFKELVDNIRLVEQSIGKVRYGPTDDEKKNRVFRRSLFVVKPIKAGEIFTAENVRSIRPGYGLAPKNLGLILGKKAAKNIKQGTPLSWKFIRK